MEFPRADDQPDLSFRAWCVRKSGRKDRVGEYARWYLAGGVGEPPLGYSEAMAEFDVYWREAVRAPAVRQATDALAAEALRRRHERPAAPDVEADEAWAFAVTVMGVLVDVLDELVDYVIVPERRHRFSRPLERARGVIGRLRQAPHPSSQAAVFTPNIPAPTREAS